MSEAEEFSTVFDFFKRASLWEVLWMWFHIRIVDTFLNWGILKADALSKWGRKAKQ